MNPKRKNNYARGASYERKAKEELERAGYFVIRSAGSHGAVDLVAIKDGEPDRLIQVKSGDVKSENKHLYALAIALLPHLVSRELWQRDAGTWRKWTLQGNRWRQLLELDTRVDF